MGILLGCIADDFTGATDLANTLVRHGMRTVQLIGVPAKGTSAPDADAVVIALKTRSCPVPEAVSQSLAAARWLETQRVCQYFFKYCSTFDSTDRGNIGPVADALLETVGDDFAIACPAFPATGRTIYNGHLFVGDRLLSESGMKDHPLTPMTDADLVRVLGRQTPRRVGLVPFTTVARGKSAIAERFTELRSNGFRFAIVDALTDDHLIAIGRACAGHRLVSGGSGVALGLPENFRRQGLLPNRTEIPLPAVTGPGAVLSGSCSQATRAQVADASGKWPSLAIDPEKLIENPDYVEQVLVWAVPRLDASPILIYSTAAPDMVAHVQSKLGREPSGAAIERAMGKIAVGLVGIGVRRLIVAGGETAGAVTKALDIDRLQIGPEIDPGVPWCETGGPTPLALALKSGNFGTENFFSKAFRMLP